MNKLCIAPLFAAAAVLLTNPCKAEIRYTVTDIGMTEGGCYGMALNNKGEVAGFSGSDERAFYWKNGTAAVLPTLGSSTRGLALNNMGQVVGWSQKNMGNGMYYPHAYSYKDGVIQDLAPASYDAQAVGVNDSRQVIYNSSGNAYIWQDGTAAQLYGVGGLASVIVSSISQNGRIAGVTYNGSSASLTMWWNGTVTNMGNFSTSAQAECCDVDDSGQVAGWYTSGGNNRAFLWQNGHMNSLGTLGGAYSRACGVNNGIVVGYSGLAQTGQHAFIWQSGQMTDLNTLIATGYADWLEFAVDINDSGQILAQGWKNGVAHSYVLTPVPEPQSIIGLLSGLIGLGGMIIKMRRQ